MSFSFGKNWTSYSQKALTPERMEQARADFNKLHDGIILANSSFLDIGFGQGLSLIIAAENGADAYGIDIDEHNLKAISLSLEAINISQVPKIKIASILDESYIREQLKKQKFNIVHSWGVLHHTGDMASAVENSCKLVSDNGYIVCAIYNKHWTSPIWKIIKWGYNLLPKTFQKLVILMLYPLIFLAKWMVTLKNPFKMIRGMEFMHNVIDWVGGYPYEYASKEEFINMVNQHGFECVHFYPARVPTGCNEYVFKKTNSEESE